MAETATPTSRLFGKSGKVIRRRLRRAITRVINAGSPSCTQGGGSPLFVERCGKSSKGLKKKKGKDGWT